MLGFIRNMLSGENDVTFSDCIIEDYLERDRIEGIEIGGELLQMSAQQRFK